MFGKSVNPKVFNLKKTKYFMEKVIFSFDDAKEFLSKWSPGSYDKHFHNSYKGLRDKHIVPRE